MITFRKLPSLPTKRKVFGRFSKRFLEVRRKCLQEALARWVTSPKPMRMKFATPCSYHCLQQGQPTLSFKMRGISREACTFEVILVISDVYSLSSFYPRVFLQSVQRFDIVTNSSRMLVYAVLHINFLTRRLWSVQRNFHKLAVPADLMLEANRLLHDIVLIQIFNF